MHEDKFKIIGGKSLKGEIEVRGAKNATTPILAATILTERPCEIDNLPLIEDVFRMLEILESMGAKIEWLTERKIRITNKDLDHKKVNQEIICHLRSSILLLGALFARFEKFKIAQPGGCIIGARPVGTHIDALAALGAEITQDRSFYYVKKIKETSKVKKYRRIILEEFSVTATENAMMTAALLPGRTEIQIAAAEPHVEDLGKFLNKMGAKIKGLGTHTLIIDGVKTLKGARHKLIPDPIEAGTFLALAAVTRGKVEVKKMFPEHLELPLLKLRKMGVNFEIKKDAVAINPSRSFRAAKIQTLPYPGIPTDLQAPLGVFATQAEGTTMIHDPMYEGRLKYIDDLKKMGANAIIADPHRALISGPTPLYGTKITSYDLRAGASLIMAALVAEGESEISQAYQVDRGYEKIEERLRAIGANIERVKG